MTNYYILTIFSTKEHVYVLRVFC